MLSWFSDEYQAMSSFLQYQQFVGMSLGTLTPSTNAICRYGKIGEWYIVSNTCRGAKCRSLAIIPSLFLLPSKN